MITLRLAAALIACAFVLGACSSDSPEPEPGEGTPTPAAGTSEPTTPASPTASGPAVTPDRSDAPPGRIVFLSFRDGDREIYITDTDGNNLQNLTNDPGVDENPDVSPDGSRVVWSSDRDGGRLHLYTMNIDGSDVRRLTEEGGEMSARWSRDGTRIAYARGGSIYVIDAEGGEPQLVMDADGSEPCRMGAFPGGWSPDETQIVYYSATPDIDSAICLTDLDDNVSLLIQEKGVTSAEPTWSPDGRYLAYRSIRPDMRNHEIFIYDLETGETRDLTNHPDLDIEPNWSADGEWIVFPSSRDNDFFDIYLLSVDGTRIVQVTTHPDKDSEPVWVP